MPQPPNRDEQEATITRLLEQVNEHQRDVIWGYLGWPPNFTNVPQRVVQELQQEVADRTAGYMAAAYLLAQDNMRRMFDWSPDPGFSGNDAHAFAMQRSAYLGKSSVGTKLAKLEKAAADIFYPSTAERPEGDLHSLWHDAYSGVFDDGGIRAAAVTETTKANAAGEWGFSNQAKKHGLLLECFWEHRKPKIGNHPCATCRKLEHTPSTLWPSIVPNMPWVWNGPPAHPHCDCEMEWRPVTMGEASSLGILER